MPEFKWRSYVAVIVYHLVIRYYFVIRYSDFVIFEQEHEHD